MITVEWRRSRYEGQSKKAAAANSHVKSTGIRGCGKVDRLGVAHTLALQFGKVKYSIYGL